MATFRRTHSASRRLIYWACLVSIGSTCTTLANNSNDPIFVGGWGDWQYDYLPDLLPLPFAATVEHAHGIHISNTRSPGDIIITYQDQIDDSKCLLRWKAFAYDQEPAFLGPGKELCRGVPHGLQAEHNDNDNNGGEDVVLYHANNAQSLHKTTLNGTILWSALGPPAPNITIPFSPTWFAVDPASPYVHLADGYGSSKIYVYEKTTGKYTGYSFGGKGTPHGQFQTCHAISWDWRVKQMVVCDRENHRLEYFHTNASDPTVFDYTHTVSFKPYLQRPCNIRFSSRPLNHGGAGMAIVPALEGPVGILNATNQLVSVVNISRVLGDAGFLHPHDAHFLTDGSGDFVLVTWNPGRIGYFRRRQKSRLRGALGMQGAQGRNVA